MINHSENALDENWPAVCPHCGASRINALDYCSECGRKLAQDRTDEAPDSYAAMKSPFRIRLARFLQLCEDVDNAEDLNDQLFRHG